MPKIKPKKFPEWASSYVQNPINKEYNRYEPAEAKKKLGWEYGETPPRQWVNYHQNLTCQWLEYLDEHLNQPVKYATKQVLPDAALCQGLLVYVKDTTSLAVSDGKFWKKITTTKL